MPKKLSIYSIISIDGGFTYLSLNNKILVISIIKETDSIILAKLEQSNSFKASFRICVFLY